MTCGSERGLLGGTWSKRQSQHVIWSRRTVRASGMCFFFFPFLLSVSFIRVLWSLLSRRVYSSQRLSGPVVAMQGKSSRRWQINRVDKCWKKAPVRPDHKRAASNLQDLEVCWDGTKAAATAVVESWYKPDTLGWTTMPDTYSLQCGMRLKGIGLTAGKKRGDYKRFWL